MQRIVIDSLPPNVKLTGDAQGKIVIVRFFFMHEIQI
jgi:hypothetical protein